MIIVTAGVVATPGTVAVKNEKGEDVYATFSFLIAKVLLLLGFFDFVCALNLCFVRW